MMIAVWNGSMTTRKWFIMELVTDVSPDTTKPTRQIWIRDVLVCGWHTWPPQDSPPAATWSNQKRSVGPPRAMRLRTSSESQCGPEKITWLRFFCAVHSRVQTGMGFFQHASSFKEIHTMWSYLVVRFLKKKSLHHMWHSKPRFLLLLCQFCPCFCKSASCEWTPAQHDTSSLSSYISQPIDLRHAIVFLCVCVCRGL